MPLSRRDACRGLTGLAGLAAVARAAHAQPRTVLVELFTSQSCSSCPPADVLLGELARRPDVVALGFHVDYWDRLGWKDPFSLPEATRRQRDYGRQFNLRAIYTPQLVVDGVAEMVGSDRAAVTRALAAARPGDGVAVALARDGVSVLVRVAEGAVAAPARVQLVGYTPGATTRVLGGENSGRTLADTNAVRRLETLGSWTGPAAAWRAPAEPGTGYAAIVQGMDGRVLGVAALPA
jgi:hypothetical protein